MARKEETSDSAVAVATMARPGVVLRRPVGSNGAFAERETPRDKIDHKVLRETAHTAEREQKRIETERRKAEAATEREAQQREREIAEIEAAIDDAKMVHEGTNEEIETDRAALDRRSQADAARWDKQEEQLAAKLRRARE